MSDKKTFIHCYQCDQLLTVEDVVNDIAKDDGKPFLCKACNEKNDTQLNQR